MIGEIIGPDLLIVLLVALVVFGGSQIPKLARGLGAAQREFHKGLHGDDEDDDEPKHGAVDVEEVADAPALNARIEDPSTDSDT